MVEAKKIILLDLESKKIVAVLNKRENSSEIEFIPISNLILILFEFWIRVLNFS